MDLTGKLHSLSIDYKTKQALVTFQLDCHPKFLEAFREKVLRVKVTQYRKQRSRSQNSYYWELLTQTAVKLGCSTSRLHNEMLQVHPRPWVIGGKVAHVPIPNTDEAWDQAMEAQDYHIKPGSQVVTGTDGVEYRTWTVLRGSSSYDTEEMTVLLNDLIATAKEVGVETETPDEIARMRMYDEQRRANG